MFEENGTYVVIAVVLALALLGVIAVQAVMVPQSAEAAGCTPGFTGFNASQGRCFRG